MKEWLISLVAYRIDDIFSRVLEIHNSCAKIKSNFRTFDARNCTDFFSASCYWRRTKETETNSTSCWWEGRQKRKDWDFQASRTKERIKTRLCLHVSKAKREKGRGWKRLNLNFSTAWFMSFWSLRSIFFMPFLYPIMKHKWLLGSFGSWSLVSKPLQI